MTSLIEHLDECARNGELPVWDNAHYTVGAMRATGFRTPNGPALVFGTVVYARREGLIGRQLYAYGSGVAAPGFVGHGPEIVGRAALLEDPDPDVVRSRVTGVALVPVMRARRQIDIEPRLPPGGLPATFTLTVLGRDVTIDVDPIRLPGVDVPMELLRRISPSELVLFRLVDSGTRDSLWSSSSEIAKRLGLIDAKVLFVLDEWRHVSGEPPSSSPDVVAMVRALEAGTAPARLIENPNCDYRLYVRSHLEGRPESDPLWGPPITKRAPLAQKPPAKPAKRRRKRA